MLNEKTAKKEFIIKLQGWQIENLLGAAALGMLLEDWCDGLVQTGINSYDTHSSKWINSVGYTIDEIKKQTKIKCENKCYGEEVSVVNEIGKWVNDKCEENEKNLTELDELEHNQRCCSCSEKKNKAKK